MEMTVSEHKGEKTVTILHIDGYLDRSNYTQLIDKAQELFSTGTENLLLDMEKCKFSEPRINQKKPQPCTGAPLRTS